MEANFLPSLPVVAIHRVAILHVVILQVSNYHVANYHVVILHVLSSCFVNFHVAIYLKTDHHISWP